MSETLKETRDRLVDRLYGWYGLSDEQQHFIKAALDEMARAALAEPNEAMKQEMTYYGFNAAGWNAVAAKRLKELG